MENLKSFFSANPHYFGLLFALFGVVMLIAAIKGAKWLFEKDVSTLTYDIKKIDGWINLFGKKTAQVIVGIGSVVVIIAGLAWFFLSIF